MIQNCDRALPSAPEPRLCLRRKASRSLESPEAETRVLSPVGVEVFEQYGVSDHLPTLAYFLHVVREIEDVKMSRTCVFHIYQL